MDILVHDIPERLLRRVTRDAKRRDVSINEAVASAVAAAYQFPREPSGSRFRGPTTTRTTILLTLPDELHRTVKVKAATEGATMRGLILAALAGRYGMKVETPERRKRTTTKKKEAAA